MNAVKHKTRGTQNAREAAITINRVLEILLFCSILCLLCAVSIAGTLWLSRGRIPI